MSEKTPEAKSLKDAFNTGYSASKIGESAVMLSMERINYIYDFAARMVVMRADWGSYSVTSTPFSQIDRDVLVAARDKLVEMGGKPPELPPEAPTLNKQLRGLNP